MHKIIYIGGVARSGTSWLGQIFDSSPKVTFRFQPLFSYEFKNWVNEDSSSEEFQYFLKKLFETDSDFLTQRDKRKSGEYPIFDKNVNQDILVFKENRYQTIIEPMLRKNDNLYFIGITRNPCAVISSWMNNEKEFPKECSELKDWRFGNCKNAGNEDFFGYYKWKEIAHLYLDLKDKYPDRVYLITYEELVMNPSLRINEIFEFLKIPLEEQTETFIRDSTSEENPSYYSVYKNNSVLDNWKKQLNEYIISEIFADLKNTRLEQFL